MRARYWTTNPRRDWFLKFHFHPYRWVLGIGIAFRDPNKDYPSRGTLTLWIGPFETGIAWGHIDWDQKKWQRPLQS